MSVDRILALLAVLGPGLVLVWWFRNHSTPPRPWLIVVSVLAAVWFFFANPFVLVRFWWSLSLWFADIGLNGDAHPLLTLITQAFVGAAIPEEGYKFLILLLVYFLPGMIGCARDAVVWGAIVGIGHALGENSQDLAEGPLSVLLGGGLKLLGLTALGVIMGYWFGKARCYSPYYLAAAYLVPVVLHGLFDVGVLVGQELGLPYLDREEIPPLQISASMLAMPASLLALLIWGTVIVRRTFAPNKAVNPSGGSGGF